MGHTCHFFFIILSLCLCVFILAAVLWLFVLLSHDNSYGLSDDMLDEVLMCLCSSLQLLLHSNMNIFYWFFDCPSRSCGSYIFLSWLLITLCVCVCPVLFVLLSFCRSELLSWWSVLLGDCVICCLLVGVLLILQLPFGLVNLDCSHLYKYVKWSTRSLCLPTVCGQLVFDMSFLR